MSIKNFGKTPARITATNITFVSDISSWVEPEYSKDKTGGGQNAFLVQGEEIFFTIEVPQIFGIGIDFCLLGYVDYIDAFNQRHRSGYSRRYNPILDDPDIYTPEEFAKRMNLVYVGDANYNYDRKRKQDEEGKDWGKEFDV